MKVVASSAKLLLSQRGPSFFTSFLIGQILRIMIRTKFGKLLLPSRTNLRHRIVDGLSLTNVAGLKRPNWAKLLSISWVNPPSIWGISSWNLRNSLRFVQCQFLSLLIVFSKMLEKNIWLAALRLFVERAGTTCFGTAGQPRTTHYRDTKKNIKNCYGKFNLPSKMLWRSFCSSIFQSFCYFWGVNQEDQGPTGRDRLRLFAPVRGSIGMTWRGSGSQFHIRYPDGADQQKVSQISQKSFQKSVN